LQTFESVIINIIIVVFVIISTSSSSPHDHQYQRIHDLQYAISSVICYFRIWQRTSRINKKLSGNCYRQRYTIFALYESYRM